MKIIRFAPITGSLFAALAMSGCALYQNPSACETQMRSEVAGALPADRLSIDHVGVGIGGSRVVVEGTLKRPVAASRRVASATSATPAIPKLTSRPAALECTFNGDKLIAHHWLKPAEMVEGADAAAQSGSLNE